MFPEPLGLYEYTMEIRERSGLPVADEACQAKEQAGCEIRLIDGVPYLRLGYACELWKLVQGAVPPPRNTFTLDASSNRLSYGGRHVTLTRAEFRLLSLLLRNHPGLSSYEHLVKSHCGDRDLRAGRVTIRMTVRSIRTKLRAAELPDQLITVVHGKGLRLDIAES